MIKLRFIPLAALALAISSATPEARPSDREVTDARTRLASGLAASQYMRLDASIRPSCTDRIDGGENRFDRMYDGGIDQACRQGR